MATLPTKPCASCDGTILWERCAESGCQAAPTPTSPIVIMPTAEQVIEEAQAGLQIARAHGIISATINEALALIGRWQAQQQAAPTPTAAERAAELWEKIHGLSCTADNLPLIVIAIEAAEQAARQAAERQSAADRAALERYMLSHSKVIADLAAAVDRAETAEAEVARLRERIKELESTHAP